MLPDCSQLPEWVCWVAQDSDGSWWAYEHEPNMADAGWYENEVGRCIRLGMTAPDDWEHSLRSRPAAG